VTRPMTDRERAIAWRAEDMPSWKIAWRLNVRRRTVTAWIRRPPTFATRACRLCGEPFTPNSGNQRYCTPAHRHEHQRRPRPTDRACELCGQTFSPHSANQRFCSAEHRVEYYRRHGAPGSTIRWRERVHALETEIAHAREQLARRQAAA
jgi:hypothetical protein